MYRSSASSAASREIPAGHQVFWDPSIPEFWKTADLSIARPGFPCFLAFLYRAVVRGEKGEEDASHILDDVLYLYPDTLPQSYQMAMVGGVVSFTTFSRLNLDALLTSFSWSESEIAIESLQLADGNYILFCLKMPQFFSEAAVRLILKQTLEAYKMTNAALSGELTSGDARLVTKIMRETECIITDFTFQASDPFSYGARPIDSFPSRPALAIATQLLDFVKGIAPRIVGSAVFFNNLVILSSLSHDLTSLLPLYAGLAKKRGGHRKEGFDKFNLWISPLVAGMDESPDPVPMTLAVASWGEGTNEEVAFFSVIVGHDEVGGILQEARELLANGMCDFASECGSFQLPGRSTGTGIIAFWPDTGIVRKSRCSTRTLQRMGACHDEFAANKMLQELTTHDGVAQVTGMRLMDVEVFVETEVKGPFQSISEAYSKVKAFLSNLPEDLQKL
jgi:hypothetical protein